jgi:VWFA-related protein
LITNGHKSRSLSSTRVCVIVLLLLSSSAYSQAPPAQPSDVPEPTIRIKKTIRLVEVDVIAKDKKGQPVTGLEAKDFTLKDNGRTEKITLFAIQQSEQPEAEAVNAQPEKPASNPDPSSSSNRTRSFSNSHPANAAPVVILMDLLNTARENQPAMKSAVLASLKRMSSQTPVALLVLGEDLQVLSDFTTDSKALAAVFDKHSATRQEGVGPAITATKTPSAKFNAIILKAAVEAFNQESGDRVDRTFRALTLIRNELTRMHGRKSLIWIGGGLTITNQEWPGVRNVIDQFNDANVAVYTVDARGVLLDYGVGADTDELNMLGPWEEEKAETRGDVLDTVARSTGGVPYRNTNDLDRAVTRALEDDSTVYALGYYPQHGEWQGKFHKIEVKVARPSVSLRYRSGYLATPEANPEPADQQQTLEAIAASPLEFPGLRFSVEAQPGNNPDVHSLTLHVPINQLRFSLQDDKYIVALQLWFIQRQPSGENLTHKNSAFSLQLTHGQFEEAVGHGLSLTSVLKLDKSAATVRVLLRDINSGKVGTVDVPVNALAKLPPPPEPDPDADSD